MVKPRDFRVPIMMSDDEMKSIDDWRFENRVATRSEAIRRLCQMGIIFDRELKPSMERVVEHIRASVAGEKPEQTFDEYRAMHQDMAIAFFNAGTAFSKLKDISTDDAIKAVVDLYAYYESVKKT